MTEVEKTEERNWTSKKDVAKSFGVDEKTIQTIVNEQLTMETTFQPQNHIKKGGYHNSQVFYDDELINMIGMQLKKNALNAGGAKTIKTDENGNEYVNPVKQSNYDDIEVGMAANAVMKSGSLQAAEEFAKLLISRTKAIADAKYLEQKNQQLQIELDSSKEWYSVKRMEKLNPDKEFKWSLLKKESVKLGKEVKKVFDQNYGEVNAYHISVWESLYFDSINYE